MKLKIESVEGFHTFVKSVKSIAPGAIFIVGDNGCVVRARNDSASIRAYFRTNVIKVSSRKKDEPDARLPVLDLTKMLSAIKMVIETTDSDEAELNVTKQFITYNGKAKFKLKTHSESYLTFHTTDIIKQQTDDLFTFDLTNELFKYSLKYKTITGEKDPKIYVYTQDDKVFVEHDDKTQNLINSLGIAVADTFTGELRNPICININNNYSKFNPLGADTVQLALQELNGRPVFLKVRSNVQHEKYVIALELISKILEK